MAEEITLSPLRLSYTPSARASITNALLHLDTFGNEVAKRFGLALDTALDYARARIAEEGRPISLPDAEASIYFSQPMYRLSVETLKKRARRSSAGLWYVYYSLRDTDGDGKVDTLRVHRVKYAASAPFSVESSDDDSETD